SVVVGACARFGDAPQLFARCIPDTEADGVDLQPDPGVADVLYRDARVGDAALLAVGNEDDVSLAIGAQVRGRLLQRVGDGGLADGVEGLDGCSEALLVEGCDRGADLGSRRRLRVMAVLRSRPEDRASHHSAL